MKVLKIDDLHKKYEEKHMLKFGDIIDLKILDALEPTKQVIDMRDVFKSEEKEAVKRVKFYLNFRSKRLKRIFNWSRRNYSNLRRRTPKLSITSPS